jgi:hypothetical protein
MTYQRMRAISLLGSSLFGAFLVSHVALIGGTKYFIPEQAILISLGLVHLFGRPFDIEKKPGVLEMIFYLALGFSPFWYRLWEVSHYTGSIAKGLAWAGRDLGAASVHLIFLARLGALAGLIPRKISNEKAA